MSPTLRKTKIPHLLGVKELDIWRVHVYVVAGLDAHASESSKCRSEVVVFCTILIRCLVKLKV